MAEVIFEPDFFSVQSFVLSESVSLPLLWVHALSTPCSRGGNRELWGKKVILLLRCSMLICEKSGLLHWMVPEEKRQMNCAAWSSKDGIGWAVEEDRELEA